MFPFIVKYIFNWFYFNIFAYQQQLIYRMDKKKYYRLSR